MNIGRSGDAEPRQARVRRLRYGLLIAGALFAIAAPLAVLLGVVGSRAAWFSLHVGFDRLALRIAPAIALVAVALGLVSAVAGRAMAPRRNLAAPLGVVALGALTFAAIVGWRTRAYRAPPVHDVSTDWTRTLLFSPALMLARGPESNPVETNPRVPAIPAAGGFGGRYVGVVNAETCPSATPAVVAVRPVQAYARAKAAALAAHLALVTDDPARGVLEGTATSFWFGFKDDVAVQVQELNAAGVGARIDMRASARLGQSDFGRNCRLVTRLRRTISP